MRNGNKKLVGSAVAGILAASVLIIASLTIASYLPSTQATKEPKFFGVIVEFTDVSTVNLTVIEKHGGEIVYNLWDQVIAKIPGENITKLAEEEVIKYVHYGGPPSLYGVEEPDWNVTIEGQFEQVKLIMYLEKTTFELGEDVKVRLVLTNIGEQDVTLRFPSSKEFDLVVYNSTSIEIYRRTWGMLFLDAIQTITLKPGENISSSIYDWEQISRVKGMKYDFLPASSGTYSIVGETAKFAYITPGETLPGTKIETTPIEITITQT